MHIPTATHIHSDILQIWTHNHTLNYTPIQCENIFTFMWLHTNTLWKYIHINTKILRNTHISTYSHPNILKISTYWHTKTSHKITILINSNTHSYNKGSSKTLERQWLGKKSLFTFDLVTNKSFTHKHLKNYPQSKPQNRFFHIRHKPKLIYVQQR